MNHSVPGRTAIATLALAALLVAAGCGGTSAAEGVASLSSSAPSGASAAPASQPEDFQQAALDYAQCLRDNGIDAADPQFGAGGGPQGGGRGLFGDIDRASPEFQAAQAACGDILSGIQRQVDPEAQAERQAQLLELAQCMRDEGIDFPDPQLGTGNGGRPGFGGGRFGDLDFQSPEFQTALETCQATLGGTFGPGGGFRSNGGGAGTQQ